MFDAAKVRRILYIIKKTQCILHEIWGLMYEMKSFIKKGFAREGKARSSTNRRDLRR